MPPPATYLHRTIRAENIVYFGKKQTEMRLYFFGIVQALATIGIFSENPLRRSGREGNIIRVFPCFCGGNSGFFTVPSSPPPISTCPIVRRALREQHRWFVPPERRGGGQGITLCNPLPCRHGLPVHISAQVPEKSIYLPYLFVRQHEFVTSAGVLADRSGVCRLRR